MMYIYLQDRFSARNCLSGRFQQALQVGVHIIFTDDEAGRGSRQALVREQPRGHLGAPVHRPARRRGGGPRAAPGNGQP